VGVGCRHRFGPTNASEDDQADAFMICLGNGRETGQPDSAELGGLGQCAASWIVTKNEAAMFDDVIHDERDQSGQ